MPKTSKPIAAFVKVPGRDAYRPRTEKERAAVTSRKQLARARKFYRQFGLKVEEAGRG